jgi:glycosyltransferase involved in cell wall biosynthesis
MKLAIFQCLDRAGGGSRASLCGLIEAIHQGKRDWDLRLVTRESGPVSRLVESLGYQHQTAAFPRFRKIWEKPSFLNDCRKVAAELAGFSPDFVLSNEWITAPHALRIARRLGIPAVSYVRDFAAIARGRKYELHRMDGLLCVCESLRQGLIKVGYDPTKVFTVYNRIARPESNNVDEEVRTRIASASGVESWLLYLGRISSRKSQVDAVRALRHLREKSGRAWGLLLAGDAEESYSAELDRVIRDEDMENVVLKLGLVSNPGWLFDLAEASVLTSSSEGLARVLIESFLCGKPAFAYPIEGLEDVYASAAPYFVAPRRDPEQLAVRMIESLEHVESLREHTGAIQKTLEMRHSASENLANFEHALLTTACCRRRF